MMKSNILFYISNKEFNSIYLKFYDSVLAQLKKQFFFNNPELYRRKNKNDTLEILFEAIK